MTTERGRGSSDSHGRAMMVVEGMMGVGRSVRSVVVRRRELGRAVRPIRAMRKIHSGRE